METDWSVAAGADDPAIEAEWSDAASGLRFVDLRVDEAQQRERIAALPEAAAAPALGRALALLNAPGGMLMTTKCDRWAMDQEELAEMADLLDAPEAPYGVASYIDVLMAHPVPMSDFLLHEEWARTTARRAAALDLEHARLDIVVRPARREGAWGFGLTMYCYGVGDDAQHAGAAWSEALEQTVPVLIQAGESMLAKPAELRPEDAPDGSSAYGDLPRPDAGSVAAHRMGLRGLAAKRYNEGQRPGAGE